MKTLLMLFLVSASDEYNYSPRDLHKISEQNVKVKEQELIMKIRKSIYYAAKDGDLCYELYFKADDIHVVETFRKEGFNVDIEPGATYPLAEWVKICW